MSHFLQESIALTIVLLVSLRASWLLASSILFEPFAGHLLKCGQIKWAMRFKRWARK